MDKSPVFAAKRIERRRVLQGGAALVALGSALFGARPARAQARQGSAAALFAYVGSFTTPKRKGHGGGINVYRIDPGSGAWSHEQLLEIVNPSFLAIDRAQRFLYSVHSDLEVVSSYAIDEKTGHLTALNLQTCGGKNPVYLAIDPSGRWIITANYTGGSVGVVPIEKDGTLGPLGDLVALKGEPGPDRVRQEGSHPHNAVFDPSGKFLAIPDLGLDRIFVFRLDAAKGKLVPNDPPFVATQKRAGPRHIAFHPKMPFAYAVDELASTVTAYRFDPQRGSLQPIQILPATPPSFVGQLSSAEIAVAPDGRVVYASNRCNDSIAIFAVDQTAGTLKTIGWVPTRANSPRFFGIDPAANFLYAANADEGFGPPDVKDTDTIVQYRIEANGMLKPTDHVINVSSPCTIVFRTA